MARRGFAFFDVLIFIVIGLVLLAFAIPMIAKQIRNLNTAGTCEPENCRQSCASATEIQNFGKSCKDGVCCEPAPGQETGGGGTTTADTKKPKLYTLPSLPASTMTATIAGNSVPGEVQVLQDAKPDTKDALLLGGNFYYHDAKACAKTVVPNNAEAAAPPTAEQSPQQTFTNPQDLVLGESSSIRITITTKSGVLYDSTPKAGASGAGTVVWSAKTTSGKIPLQGIGTFELNSEPKFPYAESADGCLMRQPFNITFLPQFAEAYAGQKLKITFTVSTIGKDSSVQRAVTYSVIPPIRHSAIGQQWTQSKKVDLWCNAPAVCADTYMYVAKFKPGAESGKCPGPDQKSILASAKEMPLPTVKYCVVGMTDKQFETRGCFETEEECRNKFPSLVVNQDYLTTVQQIAQYYGTTTDMTQYYAMFSNLQNSQRSPQCVQRSISGLETDTLYRVRDFDQKTQRGKVTLDMPDMARGRLCVYGRDVYAGVGTGNVGSAENANFWRYNTTSNITIDTEPPVVNVSYDKFKLTLKMSCNDADSGCKQAMGVAYISDMSNYFRALGRGPSQAYLYCPPPKSGVYQTETRREIVYTAADVRVLCVKGEDNAGNGAVTMVTVFNAYDMLAKSIAVAVNGGTA
jgi:hypothetical protein